MEYSQPRPYRHIPHWNISRWLENWAALENLEASATVSTSLGEDNRFGCLQSLSLYVDRLPPIREVAKTFHMLRFLDLDLVYHWTLFKQNDNIHFPKLETLNLTQSWKPYLRYLHCPRLSKLTISTLTSGHDITSFIQATSLQHLYLTCMEEFSALAPYCARLQSLSLEGNPGLDILLKPTPVIVAFPRLEKLFIVDKRNTISLELFDQIVKVRCVDTMLDDNPLSHHLHTISDFQMTCYIDEDPLWITSNLLSLFDIASTNDTDRTFRLVAK